MDKFKKTILVLVILMFCIVIKGVSQHQSSFAIEENKAENLTKFSIATDTVIVYGKQKYKGGYSTKMLYNGTSHKFSYDRKESTTTISREGEQVGFIKKTAEDKTYLSLEEGGIYIHNRGKNRYHWHYTKSGVKIASYILTKSELFVEYHKEDTNMELLDLLSMNNAVKQSANRKVLAVVGGASILFGGIYAGLNAN